MKLTTKTIATLLCGTILTSVAAAPALAQDAAVSEAATDQTADTAEEPLIIVTGTQIQGAKINDVLPVTVVGEELIDSIDPGSGDELFRAIPQAGSVAFNDQSTVGGVNGARGDIASINLRGIGTVTIGVPVKTARASGAMIRSSGLLSICSPPV